MIPAVSQWGPFANALSRTERTACLRSLRSLAHLLLGPHGRDLCRLLRECETDDNLLAVASLMIDMMPSRDRRSLLASYGAVERGA